MADDWPGKKWGVTPEEILAIGRRIARGWGHPDEDDVANEAFGLILAKYRKDPDCIYFQSAAQVRGAVVTTAKNELRTWSRTKKRFVELEHPELLPERVLRLP